MKNSIRALLVSSMLALGGLLAAGCNSGPAYTCSDGAQCARTGSPYQACCTPTQCEYRVGDQTFVCAGTDCSAAASEVVTYCTGP